MALQQIMPLWTETNESAPWSHSFLLRWNGYTLSLQENELADMFIAIAAGKANEEDLLYWLERKTNTQ